MAALQFHDGSYSGDAGLKYAEDSLQKNLVGVSQTRPLGGDIRVLLNRPQEVVAAIQALGQAYTDFFAAVGDYNRA